MVEIQLAVYRRAAFRINAGVAPKDGVFTSGRRRAYVLDGAILTVFDAPGNPIRTGVNGINNAGDVLVIGRYVENETSYPASFIWRKGVFTPLPNVPFKDAVETYVYGLNDRGDISGIWVDGGNLTHPFVAFRKK